MDSVPGWGRSPGEGNDNPLQDSCLENSMDRRSQVGNSPWGRKELDTTEQNPDPCNIPLMAKSFFSEVLSPGSETLSLSSSLAVVVIPVVLGRRLRPGHLDECPDPTAASSRACHGITVCPSLVPSCSGLQVKFLHALDVPRTVKTRLCLEYAHKESVLCLLRLCPIKGF